MADRVALVTGATRGIARGIALDLARQGWAVAVSFRTDARAANATRDAIEAAGTPALVLQADLADPAEARALVDRVEATWGRLDALVHGAGPYHEGPLLEETPERWRSAFRQNLDPLLFLAQAAAPGMQARRWGRILGLGLATADRLSAQPNVTAYYIAKAGLLVLVRSLAKVLAPHGITVNAVSPGHSRDAGIPSTGPRRPAPADSRGAPRTGRRRGRRGALPPVRRGPLRHRGQHSRERRLGALIPEAGGTR